MRLEGRVAIVTGASRGIGEAVAIDHRLKGKPTPRPMTHDLLANVIATLGGKLIKIVINDIVDHTFIATLFIRQNEQIIKIDARRDKPHTIEGKMRSVREKLGD